MIVFFLIWLSLLFPNVAFAAKPEDLIGRLGATTIMLLLVALIAVALRIIRKPLHDLSDYEESLHEEYMSQQSILDYSTLARSRGTTVDKSREVIEATSYYRPNQSQERVSRSALSLEEAILGHWVSYFDKRTPHEKTTSSKHYAATHWYIAKSKLNQIPVEIKGSEQIRRAASTRTFNILDRNERKSILRFEAFGGLSKSDYFKGTFKFSQDRVNMLLCEINTKFFYVDTEEP